MSGRTTETRAPSEIPMAGVPGEELSVGRYRRLVDIGDDVTHKMAMTNYAFTADDEGCHVPELEIPNDVPNQQSVPHDQTPAADSPNETDTTRDTNDDQVTNDTSPNQMTNHTNEIPATKDANEIPATKDTSENQATEDRKENQMTKDRIENQAMESPNESEATTVPNENEASRQQAEQGEPISNDSCSASAESSNSTKAGSSDGIQPSSAKDWRKALCQVDTNIVCNTSNRIYTIQAIEATPAVPLSTLRPNGDSRHHQDVVTSPSSSTAQYPSRLGSFVSIAAVNRMLDVRLRNCSDSKWRRIQTAMFQCPVGTM